jgi:hypothetical protein
MKLSQRLRKCVAWIPGWMRYTHGLENEIERLREENRALLNSILGLGGIPPISRPLVKRRSLAESDSARRGATQALTRPGDDAPAGRMGNRVETGDEICREGGVVPVRRRSWQQLGRVREIEDARAARRERETNREVFPTPENIVPRA